MDEDKAKDDSHAMVNTEVPPSSGDDPQAMEEVSDSQSNTEQDEEEHSEYQEDAIEDSAGNGTAEESEDEDEAMNEPVDEPVDEGPTTESIHGEVDNVKSENDDEDEDCEEREGEDDGRVLDNEQWSAMVSSNITSPNVSEQQAFIHVIEIMQAYANRAVKDKKSLEYIADTIYTFQQAKDDNVSSKPSIDVQAARTARVDALLGHLVTGSNFKPSPNNLNFTISRPIDASAASNLYTTPQKRIGLEDQLNTTAPSSSDTVRTRQSKRIQDKNQKAAEEKVLRGDGLERLSREQDGKSTTGNRGKSFDTESKQPTIESGENKKTAAGAKANEDGLGSLSRQESSKSPGKGKRKGKGPKPSPTRVRKRQRSDSATEKLSNFISQKSEELSRASGKNPDRARGRAAQEAARLIENILEEQEITIARVSPDATMNAILRKTLAEFLLLPDLEAHRDKCVQFVSVVLDLFSDQAQQRLMERITKHMDSLPPANMEVESILPNTPVEISEVIVQARQNLTKQSQAAWGSVLSMINDCILFQKYDNLKAALETELPEHQERKQDLRTYVTKALEEIGDNERKGHQWASKARSLVFNLIYGYSHEVRDEDQYKRRRSEFVKSLERGKNLHFFSVHLGSLAWLLMLRDHQKTVTHALSPTVTERGTRFLAQRIPSMIEIGKFLDRKILQPLLNGELPDNRLVIESTHREMGALPWSTLMESTAYELGEEAFSEMEED